MVSKSCTGHSSYCCCLRVTLGLIPNVLFLSFSNLTLAPAPPLKSRQVLLHVEERTVPKVQKYGWFVKLVWSFHSVFVNLSSVTIV